MHIQMLPKPDRLLRQWPVCGNWKTKPCFIYNNGLAEWWWWKKERERRGGEYRSKLWHNFFNTCGKGVRETKGAWTVVFITVKGEPLSLKKDVECKPHASFFPFSLFLPLHLMWLARKLSILRSQDLKFKSSKAVKEVRPSRSFSLSVLSTKTEVVCVFSKILVGPAPLIYVSLGQACAVGCRCVWCIQSRQNNADSIDLKRQVFLCRVNL